MKFTDFKLTQTLQEGLEAMGFESPTPIQEQAIPLILEGKDLIACAQTGTGKTAAYLLPIIHRLTENHVGLNSFKCIIIVPTRELAMQIDQQVEGFAYFCPISSLPVYGGGEGRLWDIQRNALNEGVEIVIATPGRMIAHMNMGYVNCSQVDCLILDEADRMLDMGFYDDIVRIIDQLPNERQTLLFSATMPPKIRKLAEKILRNPHQISLAVSKPADNLHQSVCLVEDEMKGRMVQELFKTGNISNAIIFSSKKSNVGLIARELRKLKLTVATIHSDMEQKERENSLLDFKNQKVQILVGTDVIARGIDIVGVSMVVNYDVPGDAEDYIHRIGRTARADNSGEAVTFVNKSERYKLRRIEQFLDYEIERRVIPSELKSPFEERVENQSTSNIQRKHFQRKNINKKPKPGNQPQSSAPSGL